MATKAGQRVGYVRVSSADQNTDRQLDGMELDKVFTDKASGKDTDRPQLKAALQYVREGDVLVVHSMDRLSRNVEDMLRTVRELAARGVAVEFVKERLKFQGNDSPMDTLLMTLLAAIAQFERALIRERQAEGIAIAKSKGVYTGRAPTLLPPEVARLVEMANAGVSKARIARRFKISRPTVYTYLRKHAAEKGVAR